MLLELLELPFVVWLAIIVIVLVVTVAVLDETLEVEEILFRVQ
jgi:hypothetical protein